MSPGQPENRDRHPADSLAFQQPGRSVQRITIGGLSTPFSPPSTDTTDGRPSEHSKNGAGSDDDGDPVLIVTRGLPGCGKTTRSQAWVRRGGHAERAERAERDGRPLRARVGRDAIRRHVFDAGVIMAAAAEEVVTRLQQQMVRTLLGAGVSVVVDDTNLPDSRVQAWAELAAAAGVELVVWDMRDVPLEVCIARDAARGAAGGHMLGALLIRQINARAGASWELLP